MKREDRPKRPWRSFQHYVEHHRHIWGSGELLYPCLTCLGSCRIVDPTEDRDPIEGHKLSRRIPCPNCVRGESTQEQYKRLYDQEILLWERRRSLFDAAFKVYQSAIKKVNKYLSKEERKALGINS